MAGELYDSGVRFGGSDLLVGVDIGGSAVKAAIVDTRTGVLRFTAEASLPLEGRERTSALVIAHIDALLSRLVHAAGSTRSAVRALGVGCPGIVRKGVVERAGNFPTWRQVDLVAELAA
eukprot:CAMPEP_0180086322 /NCGR_PEP_ID=MMETSP0985-20121206/20988_1 /TAXON_ID=483367 /ORGANISM="non described non described, Strain CCMP 2436" /LENGTH=118 /DNA_ID=CAMNT_0022020353 /DNA_START=150 /DNA_END=502 /DNA_ORIENTATION=+